MSTIIDLNRGTLLGPPYVIVGEMGVGKTTTREEIAAMMQTRVAQLESRTSTPIQKPVQPVKFKLEYDAQGELIVTESADSSETPPSTSSQTSMEGVMFYDWSDCRSGSTDDEEDPLSSETNECFQYEIPESTKDAADLEFQLHDRERGLAGGWSLVEPGEGAGSLSSLHSVATSSATPKTTADPTPLSAENPPPATQPVREAEVSPVRVSLVHGTGVTTPPETVSSQSKPTSKINWKLVAVVVVILALMALAICAFAGVGKFGDLGEVGSFPIRWFIGYPSYCIAMGIALWAAHQKVLK